MAYTQNFVSLKGTTYTLTINNVSGVTLPLAATPFETQEDDDVNVFTPVRTQSGYIRMIIPNAASRAQWQSCIPGGATAMPVRLTHVSDETTIIDWQGYVATGTYGMPYPADYEEFELPVVCPLSVLETIDVSTTPPDNEGVLTFAKLLNYIFSKVTSAGTTISKYYFQGSPSVVTARLAMKVIWANFLDTDSHGTIDAKYNCYEVLEEVCKFFGYSCRICGDAVYFTCPAGCSSAFTKYTSLTGSAETATAGTFEITDAMLATTNQSEEVESGLKRVTVSSDINKLDNLIEIPYDELFDRYYMGQSNIIARSVDYYERGIYCAVKQPNATTSDQNPLVYEDDNISMSCYMANVPGTGHNAGNETKYCRFLVYDDNEVGDLGGTPPEGKTSYSWKKCVELFHSYNYRGYDITTMFSITSKQSFVISDGVLYISFKCDQVSAWLGIIKCTAKMKLGNKYWDGENRVWTTIDTTFDLYFDSNGAKSTRTNISDPQYDGWGIPVTDTMRGVLEFSIIDVPNWQTFMGQKINGFLPLMDFEIGFVRGTIEETKHTGNEYTEQAGQFQGEENVDLIFACDVEYGPEGYKRHMPAGLGYVLRNSDEKPAATIPALSGQNLSAEEKLAKIMAAYHNHTHRCVELELWSNMVSVTPIKTSTGLETMHPVAISHSWRDDITRVKLIQIERQ